MSGLHRTGVVAVIGTRTAALFETRDKTWTNSDDITHRLAGFSRTACGIHSVKDLRDVTPWKKPNCIICLAQSLERTGIAVMQEAILRDP